jgi:hypothetical protein
VQSAGDWWPVSLLGFGILNVLVSPAGTFVVRAVAVVAALVAITQPGEVRVLLTLILWLVWPPAFMVAWALARESRRAPEADGTDGPGEAAGARIAVAALIVSVAVASLAFRAIVAGGLQQTAALFVGIPTLLAIVVVFYVSPRSAVGVACKAVTVALLASALFLGEGIVCVAMSAPLFYAIAIPIASAMETAHRRRDKSTTTSMSCVILLIAVPLSLEGVTRFTTFNRDESITETRIVNASPEAVQRALFDPPRFDRVLPLYLRAGFPSPVATRIEGGEGGTRWVIQIRGGEMRLNGMEPRTGTLLLALEDARPGFVRWRAVSDSSHMTHFLAWQETTVRWARVDDRTTQVSWTLRYRRGLDPAWYFGPWERYAVRLAAGYLIDSVATP